MNCDGGINGEDGKDECELNPGPFLKYLFLQHFAFDKSGCLNHIHIFWGASPVIFKLTRLIKILFIPYLFDFYALSKFNIGF